MFSKSALRVPSSPSHPRLSTGIASLDALLDGGLPRGQPVEISGEESSGKSTLALGICLHLLGQGHAVAWIDAGGGLWPVNLLEAGLPLDKLLVLKASGGPAALKAAHLLLSCPGAVKAVVVELPKGAQVSETNMVKLQRLAQRSDGLLLFVTERPAPLGSLASTVSLRLHVRRQARGKSPSSGLQVDVLRNKQGASGGAPLLAPVHPPSVELRAG